jgi:cell division protein ZapA
MKKTSVDTTQSGSVEILGQQYRIKGVEDQAYLDRLAKYVDQRMRELAAHAKNAAPSKLAVLTAINITHDLFQLRSQHQLTEATIEKKTKDLIESIEEQFDDLELH